MSTKAIEVTTKDFLEIEEAIERDAPISEIRELLKKGGSIIHLKGLYDSQQRHCLRGFFRSI